MITVFTPTYNRGYILSKVYESLKKQDCKDFEWIVVDDGSVDNTEQLFEIWQKEKAGFSIIYKKICNGGKHRAINLAVQMAKGDAFFIVDSDDYISDDAISFIKEKFVYIADNEDFAAISGLKCSYLDGNVVGGEVSFSDYVDATNLEREKYHLLGDKAEIYKTKILKKYPFPEFEGENFLAESAVWNLIALDGYKIRWFNKKIYFCEYLKDGLTQNLFDILQKNSKGWAYNLRIEKKYEKTEYLFKHFYEFYECMHDIYSSSEIKKYLELSDKEYDDLAKKWEETVNELKKIIQQKNIHKIALYGLGNNAKRLQLYLKQFNIEVLYFIDRNLNQKNVLLPIYNIEMELPQVESICVTSNKITDEWIEYLQKKMPNTQIWKIEELGKEIWI